MIVYFLSKLNRNLDALSRVVEGQGPMKPGNRYDYTVLNPAEHDSER